MRKENYLNQPITLTDESFDDVIHRYPLLVIDCWAPWCYPCQIIAPLIEEMAKDYAGKVVFGKLNTNENPGIPLQFEIMSIPTLLLVKNGRVVARIVGAVPRSYIESQLKKYL